MFWCLSGWNTQYPSIGVFDCLICMANVYHLFLAQRITSYFEAQTGRQLALGGYEECGGHLRSAVGPPAGGDPRSCWNGCMFLRRSPTWWQKTDRRRLLMKLMKDRMHGTYIIVNAILSTCQGDRTRFNHLYAVFHIRSECFNSCCETNVILKGCFFSNCALQAWTKRKIYPRLLLIIPVLLPC